MDPLISIKNLSVIYDLGKSNQTEALSDISIEIYPEEYVIFFGPSGCGKSTLLYVIAGLEMPEKGSVTVEGHDLTKLPSSKLIRFHQSTIGMVFQAYYLVSSLTVQGNIMLPRVFLGSPVAQRINSSSVLMERFGLSHLKKKYPNELSGGQQQRVAIARALVNDPKIILADEPVGNLDSKNAEIVLNLLSELNEKDKKTIIHVTHNPQDLYRANRVFYMRDGKITRIISNPKKKLPGEEPKVSELEKLAQLYPFLNDSKLRAKLILHHLLLPYSIDDQEKIEDVIERYIQRKITAQEMYEAFDAPPDKEGVNLYAQTAQNLTHRITALAKEIELIEEEEYPYLTPVYERASELRGYLLDTYKGHFSFEQVKRLEELLAQKILGKISTGELQRLFDLEFKLGGLGLNRRTAKRFAKEIDLILMK